MPFVDNLLQVEEHDVRSWKLLKQLTYEGEHQTFVVPAGYVTDFASVPDCLVWLINKTGPYTRAAIVHDWLITDAIGTLITSRDTDGIFRRIMREEGVSVPKRWVMWAAVRLGSLGSKQRAPGRRFMRDLPLILLIGIPTVPLIGPVALLVWIEQTLFKPLKYWR